MTVPQVTFSAVRYDESGKRLGWCSHRHRSELMAAVCCERLNRQWADTGRRWAVVAGGDRP